MDDILVLAIGRSFIELSAQREQLNLALRQTQAELAALKKQEPPKEV